MNYVLKKNSVYEDYMSASLIGELINCEVVRND